MRTLMYFSVLLSFGSSFVYNFYGIIAGIEPRETITPCAILTLAGWLILITAIVFDKKQLW